MPRGPGPLTGNVCGFAKRVDPLQGDTMKTVLLLTLACLLLSGCIIVVEQPRDAKPAPAATEKK